MKNVHPLTHCLYKSPDPGVHFNALLSDCKANIGETAELECKLSREECEGVWSKDGEEVRKTINCFTIQFPASI